MTRRPRLSWDLQLKLAQWSPLTVEAWLRTVAI